MIRRLLLCGSIGIVLAALCATAIAALPFFSVDCDEQDAEEFPPCTGSIKNPEAELPEIMALAESQPTGVPATQIVRISAPNNSGDELEDAQLHSYSRRQAWNSDETLIALSKSVLNVGSLDVLREAMAVSSSRNWSNSDPDLMFGIAYNPKPIEFRSWNVKTDEVTVLRRFERFERCSIGEGEGNLSNDDAFVVLVCEGTTKGQRTLISYDIVNDRILGELEAAPDLNWASFSQSGKYIVVENSREGGPVYKLLRYDPDFSNELLLQESPEHGDLGLDTQGDDVFVMIDWESVHYIRLNDAQAVRIPVGGSSDDIGYGHVSCRNINRPGWCYLSNSGNGTVGAIKIGLPVSGLRSFRNQISDTKYGLRAYELWGYHHSTNDSYRAYAKGSVSPSGRQVVISSDWGGQIEPSDFVINVSN